MFPTIKLVLYRDFVEAADLIRRGEVVVFPTDTVYGIGCDPWNVDAIEQLYALKQRPEEKGLPILISDVDQLERLVVGEIDAQIEALIGRFWPGALTLIFQRTPTLPTNLAPGDTIAVRLPALPLTRELIRAAGGAVATSSANISGQAAAVSAETAATIFGDTVAIVDGGPSTSGIASTIVDCSGNQLKIIRAGEINQERIAACLAGIASPQSAVQNTN